MFSYPGTKLSLEATGCTVSGVNYLSGGGGAVQLQDIIIVNIKE
jgi:hypothetical protein